MHKVWVIDWARLLHIARHTQCYLAQTRHGTKNSLKNSKLKKKMIANVARNTNYCIDHSWTDFELDLDVDSRALGALLCALCAIYLRRSNRIGVLGFRAPPPAGLQRNQILCRLVSRVAIAVPSSAIVVTTPAHN